MVVRNNINYYNPDGRSRYNPPLWDYGSEELSDSNFVSVLSVARYLPLRVINNISSCIHRFLPKGTHLVYRAGISLLTIFDQEQAAARSRWYELFQGSLDAIGSSTMLPRLVIGSGQADINSGAGISKTQAAIPARHPASPVIFVQAKIKYSRYKPQ